LETEWVLVKDVRDLRLKGLDVVGLYELAREIGYNRFHLLILSGAAAEEYETNG